MSDDMFFALASQADTTPPAAPKTPTATSICQTTFTLNWLATTDNVGVTGYKIYKGGVLYLDVGNVLSYGITGQTAGATANWTVSAYDAASNESSQSTARSVTQGVNVNSILLSANFASAALACADTIDDPKYITGPDSTPTNGDVIYNDSCGTSKLNGGGNWYSDGTWAFQVSSTGVVSLREICM